MDQGPTDSSRAWAPPDSGATEASGTTPDRRAAPSAGRPAGPEALPLPVPLRPLGLLDILDGAFNIIKLRPRTIILLALVLVLPVQVAAAFGARGQLGESLDFSTTSTFAGAFDAAGPGGLDFLFMYLTLLPLPFVGAAIGRLVAGWYAGKDIPVGELLRGLVPRAPALLGSFVVIHVAETVAAIPCGLPLPFVMPFFLMVAPAIGVEGIGGIAGLRRGWQLATRRYWSSVWVVVCSALIAGVLQLSFGLFPTILGLVVGPDWGWVFVAMGNAATGLIVTPFVCGAAVLAYLDGRVRSEGLDLELRAVEVLGRAEDPS